MHASVTRPDQLTPAELDDYLARGWYRVGQTMMTCRVTLTADALRSAIWTRVPLADYAPRKSHRKHLRRIHQRFSVVEGPCVVDAQREALYQRYRATVRGERAPSLDAFLTGGSGRDVFQTREISLWDDDRLAGFSWFDTGEEAVQSLIGVYDPDLARWSLGFTTLLLEVSWAADRGYRYHYAGYVLPGDPIMDYKLRAGPIEFLDRDTDAWLPWRCFDDSALPAEQIEAALVAARQALAAQGVQSCLETYRMWDLPLGQPALERCLAEPLVLRCELPWTQASVLLLTYEPDSGLYTLLHCVPAKARLSSGEGDGPEVDLWVVVSPVSTASAPEAAAQSVMSVRPRRSRPPAGEPDPT